MSDINPDIVEAAKSAAKRRALAERGGYNSPELELVVEAALASAADVLRAEGAVQSLRGAAETLDGAMPRHLGESDLDYLDYGTDVEYGIDRAAEFLRARADRIEHDARCPHQKCPGGSLCCCPKEARDE